MAVFLNKHQASKPRGVYLESSTSLRKLLNHLFSFGLGENISDASLNVFCVQVELYIDLFISLLFCLALPVCYQRSGTFYSHGPSSVVENVVICLLMQTILFFCLKGKIMKGEG